MRLSYVVSISFLFICMCTFSKVLRKKQVTNSDKKYVILFDLMNVIIKENYAGFAKKIGTGNLVSYTLTHWKNPGYRCLDMLEAMSNHETQKPHIIVKLRKRTMPRCLIEWQEGKNDCTQVKNEIMEGIELLDAQKHFSSSKEKNLMSAIMNVSLDPHLDSMFEPIKSTIQLAKKLKSAGHEIYIFANAPQELHTAIQRKYPDIINMFDGVVISSEIKVVKPSAAMFNHLLTTHNLAPHNCILIDDLQETVAAAQKLGMHAFVYNKHTHAIRQLRKCGIKV